MLTLRHQFFTKEQFAKTGTPAVLFALADLVVFVIVAKLFHANPTAATLISSSLSVVGLALYLSYKYKDTAAATGTFCLAYGALLVLVETYLVAGAHVFAFSSLVTKLLLMPLAILALYAISYSITARRSLSVSAFFKNNWGLLALNLVLVISTLAFIKAVPFATSAVSMSAAPDEAAHYNYNVGFILEHHRLPVAGVDDASAYKLCNINQYKQGVCLYSYTVFPGANYVFSAATAKIMHDVTGIDHVTGARFAGLLWAIVTLNFLYLAAVRLTKKRPVAWLISSLVLLPQVIFIGSYTNQDIHSLAISALVLYALVRLVQERTAVSIIFAGVAFGGLLPLAKYNYFILAPIAGVILLYCVWRKVISAKILGLTLLASSVSFIIISAFWYVRNLVLYHDLLGQQYVRHLTSTIVPSDSLLGLNFHSLQILNDIRFFDYLFNSFFAAFGYMIHFLPDAAYTAIKVALVVLFVAFVVIAWLSKKSRVSLFLALGVFAGAFLLAVGLVYFNAVTFDPQAQGRYVFNILAPLVGMLAFSYHHEKRMILVIGGIALVTLCCFISGAGLFLQHYAI